MKNLFKFGFFALLAFAFAACETEMIERFDIYSFEQGGYMRTVSSNGTGSCAPICNAFNVSRANMAGSRVEMIWEAVTPNFGANFDRYETVIRFVDNTPANGNNSKPDQAFRTYNASQFAPDATTKYPRLTVSFTGKELQDAMALTDAQLSTNDRFEIRAKMFLKDGKVFDATNTGVNITGGAFYNSPFLYRITLQN